MALCGHIHCEGFTGCQYYEPFTQIAEDQKLNVLQEIEQLKYRVAQLESMFKSRVVASFGGQE